jgi:hypothetical protein
MSRRGLFWIIFAAFLISLLAEQIANAQTDIMTGFACAGDAFHFCSRSTKHARVPDAIEACLRAHEKELSVACSAAIKGHR